MNHSYLRNVYLRLAGVVMVVVVLALAANGFLSHRIFEQALVPELAKKAVTVGTSVRSLVFKALEHGLEFNALHGVEETFAEIDAETPEMAYFSITDTSGRVLYQRPQTDEATANYLRGPAALAVLSAPDGAVKPARVGKHYIVSMPIVRNAQPLGMLHVGIDVGFVDGLVLEMLYDVLVVLVVSLFFTLELLHFMAGAKLEESLRALGDTFSRGAAGDFTEGRRAPGEQAFSGVMQRLQATLARVNNAYLGLVNDVDAARRVPAHERPVGLAAAQTSLQTLGRRYKFGRDDRPFAPKDDTQLSKVRAPLFVFILAEELTRSFLPGYVKELLVPIPWLSPQLVVGLPIALFMLIVALGQPYFGVVSERVGHRRTMLMGAGIAAAGFVASALAGTVLDLLLWRSLCAVGYAMVFVAAQAYVLEHSNAANRASSFATFVGAIMVATVCGPSIGGILADNIGERGTFVVAAFLAIVSLANIVNMPDRSLRIAEQAEPRVPSFAQIGTLLTNRRFLTVTALAAMPAKILLTGLCFYLVPLYVVALGSTQAMAGRILMTYGVMMVVMSPVAARWAISRERMEWLVGGGLVLSGLGGLLLMLGAGLPWVFVGVALVGAGQSLSISAQSALVSELCAAEIATIGEGAVFGVYRLLERMGNAIGPLLAAALVMGAGYRTGFIAIGGLVVVCGLAFVLATRRPPGPVAVPASTH